MIPFSVLVWWIFVLATAANLGYWIFVFSKLAFYKKPENPALPDKLPLVSLVICARNEEKNLKKHLPRFLTQTYRSFEIVIVEDNSADNSLSFLYHFQKTYSNFRIIIIPNICKNHPGKKEALEMGISAARGELILLTDADCVPASDTWIASMVAALRDKSICLGYAPYQKSDGWLNWFIRLETIYTASQYFSFALAGIPYMGVGRNLMYRKRLFEKAGGLSAHKDLASGDDDLFVNAIATNKNTSINLNPDAFVVSVPPETWRQFYRQKSRHLTAARRYRPLHQVLLGGLSASHFLHYLGGLVLLYMNFSTIFVFLIFVLRIGVITLLYAKILEKLTDKSLWIWIPFFDACMVLYYVVFSKSLLKGKTEKWK